MITTFTESDFEDGHTVREQAFVEMGDDVDAVVSAAFVSLVDESPRNPEQRNAALVLGQLESDTEHTVERLLSACDDDDDYLRIIAAGVRTLDPSLVEATREAFVISVDDESVGYNLASSVRSNLQAGPENVIWGHVACTNSASRADVLVVVDVVRRAIVEAERLQYAPFEHRRYGVVDRVR